DGIRVVLIYERALPLARLLERGGVGICDREDALEDDLAGFALRLLARFAIRRNDLRRLLRIAERPDAVREVPRQLGGALVEGGQVHGNAPSRQRVEDGAFRLEVAPVEVDGLTAKEPRDDDQRLLRARELLGRRRPFHPGRHLVHRLARADSEERATGGEKLERRGVLSDDDRVVAMDDRRNAAAQ